MKVLGWGCSSANSVLAQTHKLVHEALPQRRKCLCLKKFSETDWSQHGRQNKACRLSTKETDQGQGLREDKLLYNVSKKWWHAGGGFFFFNIYFFLFFVSVLLAFMNIHYVYAGACRGQKRAL